MRLLFYSFDRFRSFSTLEDLYYFFVIIYIFFFNLSFIVWFLFNVFLVHHVNLLLVIAIIFFHSSQSLPPPPFPFCQSTIHFVIPPLSLNFVLFVGWKPANYWRWPIIHKFNVSKNTLFSTKSCINYLINLDIEVLYFILN